MAIARGVGIEATAVASRLGIAEAVAVRLLPIAISIANQDGAANAPTAIADEAVVLICSHLAEQEVGGAVGGRLSQLDVGGAIKMTFRRGTSPARLSGARHLLAPWAPVTADDQDEAEIHGEVEDVFDV